MLPPRKGLPMNRTELLSELRLAIHGWRATRLPATFGRIIELCNQLGVSTIEGFALVATTEK